jgi:hypothetical protein
MKKPFIKLLIVTTVIFSVGFCTTSQAQLFTPGEKVLNIGLGFGPTWYTGGAYTSSVPPISVYLDYGWRDDIGPGTIGLGGYVGYSSYKWEYTYPGYSYGWKYTSVLIGALGTYHLELVEDLDTYTGLLLGFRVLSAKETGTVPLVNNYSASSSGLAGSWFIGAKYYFSDNFGAFAELGYGIAYFTLGVSLKL